MRRAAALVLGTLTGTALMVAAKVGNTDPAGDLAADGGTTGSVVVNGGPDAGVTSRPAPSRTPTSGHTPTGRPTRTPTPTPGRTTTTPKPPPATTPAPSAGLRDGTYHAQAPVSGGRYGTLSMSVTVSGGKITAISAGESGGETNCYRRACNTLKPEALTAQSADVASVSGATYTSSAFRSALAAILGSAKA